MKKWTITHFVAKLSSSLSTKWGWKTDYVIDPAIHIPSNDLSVQSWQQRH